jgi:gluconolactonase
MRKRICRAALWLLAAAAVARAQTGVVAPGARLEKLADGFSFTEGPTADREGNVYFTDQPHDRILRWSVEGKLSTFLEPSGRANGMYFDRKGRLLACADQQNQLWTLDSQGRSTVLVQEYQGKPLNGPNDVWVRPDGGIYFTDPFYQRPYWKHTSMPQEIQAVYFLASDGKRLKRVAEDLKQPNGIIGTPDGTSLFVADIGAGKTYKYAIEKDGSLSGKQLFCGLGSDGMTLDREGNLYLTGKGVTVFDSSGRQIDHIQVPEPWTANVSFGGPDRQTLFITASKGLYSIRTRVRGSSSSGK